MPSLTKSDMNYHLAVSDYSVIIGYFAISIVAGMFAFRSARHGAEDFLVASRKVTLPAFVATTVSTFYGGILGVGEYSYLYGLSNWFVFGLPYYIYALIFAWKLAGTANKARLLSIPDQLEKAYGRPAAMLGAGFLFFSTVPGAYVLMVATLLQMAFGLSFAVALLIAVITSSVYIVTGGLKSVVYADIVQFILMFAGFIVIVAVAIYSLGGIGYLQQHIPPTHFSPTGGQSIAAILVWYFIAMTTLVEPAFYQRCFAAESPKTARNGMLWSVVFWFIFDFLTTTSGMYARALFPTLEQPTQSYALLADAILPPILKGLFWTAMFATVMSTVNSYSFLAAITLGRDLIGRMLPEQLRSEKQTTRLTQIGLLISLVIAAIIASLNDSVVEIWREFGSVFGPALVLPLLSSWRERWRMKPRVAFWAMLSTFLISFAWTMSKHGTADSKYLFGIEPIYPAIIVALTFWLISVRKQLFTSRMQ